MFDNPLGLLTSVLGIVVIDLVLSGDNAVVIGLAASRLPPKQRRLAIILGGAGAIGLRVLFAAIASLLLVIPLLQATGGLLLLYIAWKLLHEEKADDPHVIPVSRTLFGALRTIIIADVAMSLDNILAIAGVSHGDVGLLVFGLLLSMPLILLGSSLIATIVHRYPVLNVVGAAILAWTAAGMVVEDKIVHPYMPAIQMIDLALPAVITIAILIPSLIELLRTRRAAAERQPTHPHS